MPATTTLLLLSLASDCNLLSSALLLTASTESTALSVVTFVGSKGLLSSGFRGAIGSGCCGILLIVVFNWSGCRGSRGGIPDNWCRGSSGSSISRLSTVGSVVAAGGLTFGGNLLVQGVETLGFGAVEVEPPIADEVVLVEDGSVGAEEGILGKAALSVSGTDVEDLALSLSIGVIS